MVIAELCIYKRNIRSCKQECSHESEALNALLSKVRVTLHTSVLIFLSENKKKNKNQNDNENDHRSHSCNNYHRKVLALWFCA